MYTRCPQCGTVFRVTANLLQMAEGQVCCGACGATFSALTALFDQPPPPGWSSPPSAAPPSEPALADSDPAADETLEFNVPEQEWSRFFVDAAETTAPTEHHRVIPELGEDFAELDEGSTEEAPTNPFAAAEAVAEGDAVTGTNANPWDDFPADATKQEMAQAAGESLYMIARSEQIVSADHEFGPDEGAQTTAPKARLREVPDTPEAGVAQPHSRSAAADPIAPAPAGHGSVLDWGAPPGLLPPRVPQPRRVRGWLAGSLVLLLLLAAQLVHYNRDALAADMRYGWLIRTSYERLNQTLYPAWPIDAYEIRGTEAIVDERNAAGTLDVVAQIAVKGRQPVGLPMVRLMLRDRWSNPVGSRLLSPDQYLPAGQPLARTYPPGAVIPVRISVKDPGVAAQGYELDVCLPHRYLGLQCQSSGDPFRRTG